MRGRSLVRHWRPALATVLIMWMWLYAFIGRQQQAQNAIITNAASFSYGKAVNVINRVLTAEKYYAPAKRNVTRIWPSKDSIEIHDRIENQMKYVPSNYKAPDVNKLIVLLYGNSVISATRRLKEENCPVQACTFSGNSNDVMKADAVVFKTVTNAVSTYAKFRHPRQIWVIYQLESPMHSDFTSLAKHINWTATYRRDSAIVTPYEKFSAFSNITDLPEKPKRNFALNKTKAIAWFVSNCNDKNGRREYVKELRKYISVDIYGRCGELTCKRTSDNTCFKLLSSHYKFYLSFENSNCKDYITEKLYWNAYLNNVVPIVMGAHPDDYAAVAPPNSYIHVDDFESPKQLAQFLHRVDQDDDLYNSFFRWKGTGQFINTKFWCRLCSMVHGANDNPFMYSNVQRWWKSPEVCTKPSDNNGRWSSWRYAPKNFSTLLP